MNLKKMNKINLILEIYKRNIHKAYSFVPENSETIIQVAVHKLSFKESYLW